MINNGIKEKKVSKRKIIFVPMACDFIHEGHLNIINKAKSYGDVVVGLLTDDAISKYKPLAVFKYAHRYKIVSALKDVKNVIKVVRY